jgi:hypothetical protein
MVTSMFCPQCQSGSDDSTTEIPYARTDTDEWDRGEIVCFRCLYYTSGTPDEPPINQVFHRLKCPHCEFPMATNYHPEVFYNESAPTVADIRSIECLVCRLKIKQRSTGIFVSRQPVDDDMILLQRNDMIREAQIHWRNTVQDILNSTWNQQELEDFEGWLQENYFGE